MKMLFWNFVNGAPVEASMEEFSTCLPQTRTLKTFHREPRDGSGVSTVLLPVAERATFETMTFRKFDPGDATHTYTVADALRAHELAVQRLELEKT